MNWIQFKDWALLGLIGGACGMGIYMLRRVVSSVERLNDKVGTLITDGSWFKEKFTQHEKAIHHLEQNAIDHERRISVCESKHEV